MRTSWIIGALVTFLIGWTLTKTIIGAIIGLPLIILSILLLLVGIVIPGKRTVVHVHHKKGKSL